VIARPISDRLVTFSHETRTGITSGPAPEELAAQKSGQITYTLSTATGGVFTADLGFISRTATDGDILLAGSTVTGTVTDLATAVIVSDGNGLLTFSNGHYVLDLGDIAANSGVHSTLVSMLNTVKASAFSEVLTGFYSGLGSDGFSLALHNPFNAAKAGEPVLMLGELKKIGGGMQTDLGLLGFDPTGLSLGQHSQVIDFKAFSELGTLSGIGVSNTWITVKANVIAATPVAGVPEPATWGLMLGGFGMIGAVMRRRATCDTLAARARSPGLITGRS